MKLGAVVSYAKDNVDRATIAFTLIHAALEAGHKVQVALASEGVRLMVKGYAEDMNNGAPFKPMKELIESVIGKGGEIHVCSPCMKKRGLEEKDMMPGMRFIGGGDVIRLLDQCDKSLQW